MALTFIASTASNWIHTTFPGKCVVNTLNIQTANVLISRASIADARMLTMTDGGSWIQRAYEVGGVFRIDSYPGPLNSMPSAWVRFEPVANPTSTPMSQISQATVRAVPYIAFKNVIY